MRKSPLLHNTINISRIERWLDIRQTNISMDRRLEKNLNQIEFHNYVKIYGIYQLNPTIQ